jgi:hypothetical protein
VRSPIGVRWRIASSIRDATGQAVGYIYFDDEPQCRSATILFSHVAIYRTQATWSRPTWLDGLAGRSR